MSTSTVTARRLPIVALALVGAVATLWPSTFPDGAAWNYLEWTWRTYAVLGNVAALAGVALAMLLALRSTHPAAPHLAASLGFGALAFGVGTDPALPWSMPDWALRGAAMGLAVLAMAGFVRFTGLFPAPYHPDPDDSAALRSRRAATPLARLVPTALAPLVPHRVRKGRRRMLAWYRARAARPRDAALVARIDRVRQRVLEWVAGRAWSVGAVSAVLLAGAAALGPDLALLVGYFLLFPAFMVAMLLLQISYATGSESQRREVLWVAQGFTLTVVIPSLVVWPMILTGVFGNQVSVTLAALLPASLALSGCALVGCLAVAVFGAGAMDPGAALRRTLIYGVLGAVTTLTFEVMESVASTSMMGVMGVPGDRAVWVSSGVAAIVFGFAHQRLTTVLLPEKTVHDTAPDTASTTA